MAELNLDQLFHQLASMKVGVVGDIMLDTYWWGNVDRVSPEAPVPVVALTKKEHRLGGAGNVALNVHALGAGVSVISVLGKDEDGDQLAKLLNQHDIGTSYLVHSDHRITTNKTRIISRNQQMMRLDAEMVDDLCKEDEDRLIYVFEQFLAAERPDIVILEDYNKGVLTEQVITSIISLCKKNGIATAVDPKRRNFFAYKGVDLFKPNIKEAREGLNMLNNNVSMSLLEDIHISLEEKLGHKASLVTLSEKGIFFQQGERAGLIPAYLHNVADVSGAGDTVIAVASLVYAATKDIELMAGMANIAGGLVCGEVGTVAIDREKFKVKCQALLAWPRC